MRHLLAITVLALTGAASAGCRGASARVLSADAPHPQVAELHVRSRVRGLWRRQAECFVVAEYAGHRGEAGVPMTEGRAEPEDVTSVIAQWVPSPDAPMDHVRVTFYLRQRRLHQAQFPPPFDPRALTLQPSEQPPPPAEPTAGGYEERQRNLMQPAQPQPANPLATGGEEARQRDLRRGQPPASGQPAPGGETRQTNLLQQGAAQRAPCPVCEEPRGDASPCPHCGIE